MNSLEFSTLLAGWCERNFFSNVEVAAEALGCPYGTLRGWLSQRGLPCRLTMAAVLRQVREGSDPLTAEPVSPMELAAECKIWRAKHSLSQKQAGAMLGWAHNTLRSVESMKTNICQPALAEILHQIRRPLGEEEVAAAKVRERPFEPAQVAAQMRQWRKSHRLNRRQAADALKAMGHFTTARTIWVWESAKMLPNRPLALMEKLAETPPKTEASRREIAQSFGKVLRAWRKKRGFNQRIAMEVLGEIDDQGKMSRWESGKQAPKNMPALLAKMEAAK